MLLEIGLWKTVDRIFQKQMEKAETEGLPPPDTIKEALRETARRALPSEMGHSYARSVERCLSGEFEVDKNSAALLSAAFRKFIMDAIVDGMKL